MLSLSGEAVVFFWPPVASAAGGARGYDCGPERSLRTSPLSTSYAFGFLRFPSGASTRPAPRRPPTPRATA